MSTFTDAALREHALDLTMARWRVRMRQFFGVELPVAGAAFLLAILAPRFLDARTVAEFSTVIRGIQVVTFFVLCLIWFRRMPPPRPDPSSAEVRSELDRLIAARHGRNRVVSPEQ